MFTCSAYVTFPHEDVEVQLVEVWQRITCDGCKNSNYNILVNLEILDKYPALVLHYSGVLLLLLLLRFPRILTGESYYSTS